MADAVAEFVIKLKNEMSSGAEAAAKALGNLRKQIKADESEIASMQKALRALEKVTTGDTSKAMDALKNKIKAKSESVGIAQNAFVQLGGKFETTGHKARGFKARLEELAKQTKGLPGPLGSVVSTVSQFTGNITAAGLRTALLVSGFVALAGAAALGAKSLFDAALASGDAARNERIHLEALTKVRNMWGVAPGNADQMQAAIDRVSASVSVGRDKVAGYADTLYRSGLRGKNFEDALEGASIKSSALGEAAGSAFAGMASTINLTGGSVKRFSQDVKNRFGGVVQKQMSSLEVQARKGQEAYASLFRGVKIEPYLNSMKRLRDLFSQNEESGRALKQILTMLLQPLFDSATGGSDVLRHFFKGILIGVQEITIAFLIVRNWFRKAFGSDTEKTLAGTSHAVGVGRIAVYMMAAAFGVLAISVLAATWPFVLGALAIAAFLYVLNDVIDFWGQIDFGAMGKAMIDGIVNGLMNAGAWLYEAIDSLATKAKDTFKSILGIASPSTVFAGLGFEIPKGVAAGVEQGSPEAQTAVGGMIAPKLALPKLDAPSVPLTPRVESVDVPESAPPASPASQSTPSSKGISIGELHIHSATDKPKDFALAFRRELESIFEGAALEVGARPLGA